MKKGTEIYFGGKLYIDGVEPECEADVKFLVSAIQRFAAKNGFELTDKDYHFKRYPNE